jgi:hypothetical protein
LKKIFKNNWDRIWFIQVWNLCFSSAYKVSLFIEKLMLIDEKTQPLKAFQQYKFQKIHNSLLLTKCSKTKVIDTLFQTNIATFLSIFWKFSNKTHPINVCSSAGQRFEFRIFHIFFHT